MRMVTEYDSLILSTCVSAKMFRVPAMAPTPFGIQVLISCGLSSSWSCSSHRMPAAAGVTSSVKWYWIVFRKLYAGFGGIILEEWWVDK